MNENKPAIIEQLKPLMNYLDRQLPMQILENISLKKTIEKISSNLGYSEKRLMLTFDAMSRSNADFLLDASDSNYSEERISLNGKTFSMNTEFFTKEVILLIDVLANGFKEVLQEMADIQDGEKLKAIVDEPPQMEEDPFKKILDDEPQEEGYTFQHEMKNEVSNLDSPFDRV